MPRLLLVDSALLHDEQQLQRERLEALIAFSKGDWRLLFLSWQPEQWLPSRRSVDQELVFQQQIHEQLTRWGADLDGFVYLPSPVFGRRRLRARCLSAVAKRYQLTADAVSLLSARPQNIEAGIMAGLSVIQLASDDKRVATAAQAQDLEQALAQTLARLPS